MVALFIYYSNFRDLYDIMLWALAYSSKLRIADDPLEMATAALEHTAVLTPELCLFQYEYG